MNFSKIRSLILEDLIESSLFFYEQIRKLDSIHSQDIYELFKYTGLYTVINTITGFFK